MLARNFSVMILEEIRSTILFLYVPKDILKNKKERDYSLELILLTLYIIRIFKYRITVLSRSWFRKLDRRLPRDIFMMDPVSGASAWCISLYVTFPYVNFDRTNRNILQYHSVTHEVLFVSSWICRPSPAIRMWALICKLRRCYDREYEYCLGETPLTGAIKRHERIIEFDSNFDEVFWYLNVINREFPNLFVNGRVTHVNFNQCERIELKDIYFLCVYW